jgi:hypothetical protein
MTPASLLHLLLLLLLLALIVGPVSFLLFLAALPGVGLAGPPRRLFYRAHRLRLLLLALAGLGWCGLAASWWMGFASGMWPLYGGAALTVVGGAYLVLYPTRLFHILHRPTYQTAEEVRLADDHPVMGLATEGPSRAYTLETLLQPHGAVDTLGEEPLLVTWCTLSHCAIAFHPGPEVSDLTKLHPVTALNDNICFYDDGNGNLFRQIEEGVVCGPDAGRRSDTRTVTVTTWGRWRRLFPDTLVSHMPPERPQDHLVRRIMLRVHRRVATLDRPFHPVDRPLDPRLPPMTPVLALCLGGEARAWPRDLLHQRGVLEAEVGDAPLVLLADSEGELASAYSRRLDGEVLDLAAFDDSGEGARDGAVSQGPARAVARSADGSRWDLAGRCVAGPRQGARLESPPHFQSVFWFAWALAHPETDLERPGPGRR